MNSMSKVLNIIFLCADVSSWLQLFGFQLHNVVPGFPKPKVENTEQTYEMMATQLRTQTWDTSKVLQSFPISSIIYSHFSNKSKTLVFAIYQMSLFSDCPWHPV